MANNIAALDLVFYALADPTRLAVVQRLGRGPATVNDLAKPFAMALPSFMKHVGILERTGLITSRKAGRIRTCVLKPQKLAAAERWFEDKRTPRQFGLRHLHTAQNQGLAHLSQSQESQSCPAPMDHTKLASTVRYLGIEVEDALELAEQTEA